MRLYLVICLIFAGISLSHGAGAPAAAQGVAGNYLAATAADYRGDFAAGAKYLNRLLSRDPNNQRILDRALFFNIASGDTRASVSIARKLEAAAPRASRFGSLVLAVEAFKEGDMRTLEGLVTGKTPFPPLVQDMLTGWMHMENGNVEEALAFFDRPADSDARRAYNQYNKALALAIVGDFEKAAEILEGDPSGPLRLNIDTVYFHADVLNQLDRRAEAQELLGVMTGNGAHDGKAIAMRQRIADGTQEEFTFVTSASDAVAENLRSLAQSLGQPDTLRAALIYARLASYLDPGHVRGRLLSATVLEELGQYELAIGIYDNVPDDADEALDANIGRAAALRQSGQSAEAIDALKAVVAQAPDYIEGYLALGDTLRGEKEFEPCIDAYTQALNRIDAPETRHWAVFYTRGICQERAGQWEGAEADFRKALELQPDQPLVLNYLGYSLIEKRIKMEEAEEMIRKAVAARPNDGYITDSLGWVLYLNGRYEEAVGPMERAAELLPVDPIVNDHLGDVLWKVGRRTEAYFHWKRALSFEPEDKDAERIRRKLDMGLDRVLEEEATQ